MKDAGINLRHEVSAELVKRGFRQVDRMHLLRVDEEWSFWVDTGPLEERADISPFVGIRHDHLQRTCSELMDLPHCDTVGTLGANVGYILDGIYRTWNSPSQPAAVLEAIDKAFARLRPLMSLEKICEGWKIKGTTAPGWQYREITALYLKGEKRLVLEKLKMGQASFCKRDDGVCKQFKNFEQRLLAKIADIS